MDITVENIMREKKCNTRTKLSFGLGHVFNDLCAAVWFSYTLFYLQIMLKLSSSDAGVLLMTGQVVDSLATPAAGWVLDRTGARKAWHIAGTVSVTIGFSLIYTVDPIEIGIPPLIYYHIFIVIFQIGWAVVQIAHLSVIPVISPDNACSSELTAIRYTASVCCNIFVYVLTWLILKYTGSSNDLGPDDINRFNVIVLIIVLVGLACSVVYYYGVDFQECESYENIIANEIATGPQEQNPEQVQQDDLIRELAKSVVIYLVSVMYMCARLFSSLCLIYIPLYLHENEFYLNDMFGGLRGAIAVVPLVSFIASFIAALALKFGNSLVDEKITYLVGGLLSLAACVWICLGGTGHFYAQIASNVAVIGVGNSLTMVSSLSMAAEIVKSHGMKSAAVYSTITFTDKLISGIVVLLIQHIDCVEETYCSDFYRHVLGYVCGTTASFGILSLILLYAINKYLAGRV